jgi:hypothetical protein
MPRRIHPLCAAASLLPLLACGHPRISASSTQTSTEGSSDGTDSDSSSSTTGVDTTSEGETFVPEYDEPPEPCDSFMQDCPDGEKCVPYGSTGGNWDNTKCVPVLGDQAAGEPCTYDGVAEATDNCDATTYCWDVIDVDGEAIGTCTPFCTGTPDQPECPPGSSCLTGSDFSITLCIESCDPVAQDCYPGQGCYWANNDFDCIFTTLDLPVGEPCGFINDCVAGSACIDANLLPDCAGSACCSPFCSLGGGDTQCEGLPGTSCLPFFEQPPPGYEQVGICISP